MRRDIAGLRLRLGRAGAPLAALGVLAVLAAGCGSQGGTGPGAAASASAAASGSDREASSGKAGHNPLAKSRLRVLTTLSHSQLCAALSVSEARRILGSRPQKPLYADQPGLGIDCRWLKRGAAGLGSDWLSVGISSATDWSEALQVDKQLLHAKSVHVEGRAALTAGPLPAMQWAQVDVALGGPGDPVAEYRAPTMRQALAMARTATPHIVSMG
jgi:hypothetical protein